VRKNRKRIILAAASIALVAATFFFLLPKIADYEDVWDVVRDVSWQWIVVLLVATAINLATFAPPWMAALPGLGFVQALELTQASTAVSIAVPGGPAAGMATSFTMLQRSGFRRSAITRGLSLTALWNQFLNFLYPVVAVFALTISGEGEKTALLATAAFIGVAALGVGITGFVLALTSGRLAHDVGNLAARLTTWALTLASLVGSLSVFAVFLVSLRALDVPASEVALSEAFAAWALARLVGSIPITPGGIGVVELTLTSTLVAFGGNNAGVVAAVLVYRFLSLTPTLVFGLIVAATWRRHARAAAPQPVGTSVPPV
jgi:uncharacterized membrane protein YbhN (UPF0104 family)